MVKIISNKEDTEYNNKYICLVNEIDGNKKYKNTKLILYTNKNTNYKYGDIINVNGDFKYASCARNYRGFNYRRILWQEKIYGIVYEQKGYKITNKKSIESILNCIKIRLENNINESIVDEKCKSFLKSIILGDKTELSKEIEKSFRDANLSHILAISGMHISYIIIFIKKIFSLLNSKKKESILGLIIIFFYVIMIGKTPSSIRALVMFSMNEISNFFYRKSNVFVNLFSSLIILLVINPYYIENVGVWLSFFGTFGIIVVYSKWKNNNKNIFFKYICENFLLSISVWLFIAPIIVYNFNTISLTFFISNIITSIFISPIILLGFIICLFGNIFGIGNFISNIEIFILNIIFSSASFISNLSLSKIFVKTPIIVNIIIYYLALYFILNRKKYLNYLKILFIFFIIINLFFQIAFLFQNNFSIYFIDVGQGDCTLIKTKSNKTILIDGGEGNSNQFDQGEYTVLPYLLDRRISKLDYIIVSHFDSDHVRTEFYI